MAGQRATWSPGTNDARSGRGPGLGEAMVTVVLGLTVAHLHLAEALSEWEGGCTDLVVVAVWVAVLAAVQIVVGRSVFAGLRRRGRSRRTAAVTVVALLVPTYLVPLLLALNAVP